MLGALGRLVAPDILPLHDLQDHWSRILDYYSTKSVLTLKAEPIEATRLLHHLNKILAILVTELENVETGELGPCLEFFLGQDILNILVTLGQADTPPGIRPIIFKLFIFLLEQVKYPLLYETACHLPLCRLTLLCSLTKASPTESQELDFLTLICDKILKSPHLVQVFLPEDEKDGSKLGSSRSSRSSSMINLEQVDALALNVIKALGEVRSKHYLATALLNYLDSPDYFISCRAMQNLINISGLDCDESADALVENLVDSINSRVSSLFQSIPVGIEAGRIEELEVNWIQAHKLYSPEFEGEWFPGRSELISFLSFLDYVNNLVDGSHKLIAESIAGDIGRLLIYLYRGILAQETKDKELRFIAYICVTWSHLKSSLLRDHLTRNIFAESELESSIFNQMLEFWSEPGEIKIDALRVFDSILSSPHQLFIDCLLGQYLEYRGYCVHNIAEVEASSWSDVEDERSRSRSRSKSLSSQPNEDSVDNEKESPESSRLSRTMAPANIHRVVNMWLYLVNDELRLDEFRGSGYDLYIKDAGRQVEDVCGKCAGFGWGREAMFSSDDSETSSIDSRCESDPSRGFNPGPFMIALLKQLDQVLENDYDTNLQVTSIFSRLAQLPQPYIHEYLLNPTLHLVEGVNTLNSTLRSVMNEATVKCSSIKHYPKKMLHARKKLLGDNSGALQSIFENTEEEKMMNALVVLDEFGKELAAICLVKYHLYSQ